MIASRIERCINLYTRTYIRASSPSYRVLTLPKFLSLNRFSLQSDDDSGSLKGSRPNETLQMTSKRETVNDLTDALLRFETNQERRPMTSGRKRNQTGEEQLVNDFTNEELARFWHLP